MGHPVGALYECGFSARSVTVDREVDISYKCPIGFESTEITCSQVRLLYVFQVNTDRLILLLST